MLENPTKSADNRAERDGVSSTDAPLTDTRAERGGEGMADSEFTKSPAFQFYPNSFLGDGDQAGMSLQECGIYIRLMCYEWNAHGNGIPDDLERCANMVKATGGQMRKMWAAVRQCFEPHPTDPGRLIHPRLEKERQKQAAFKKRQSEKGKASGASRRATGREPDVNHGSTGAPTGTQPNTNSTVYDLQSTSTDSSQKRESVSLVPARRSRGLMEGSLPSQHGDCLAHGPVCFRPRIASKYLQRFGGNHTRMVSWAKGVCDDWTDRVESGQNVPEGDDFAFWSARYDEHFKHTSQPAASKLTVALTRASADFLREP